MSRVCQLTGTRANNGMAVSHSHIRTKKLQQANLQQRRLWWAEGNKWLKLRVSTRALKTIQKKGLGPYAKSLGIDLNKIWTLLRPTFNLLEALIEWWSSFANYKLNMNSIFHLYVLDKTLAIWTPLRNVEEPIPYIHRLKIRPWFYIRIRLIEIRTLDQGSPKRTDFIIRGK